jgi:hypothetical protein
MGRLKKILGFVEVLRVMECGSLLPLFKAICSFEAKAWLSLSKRGKMKKILMGMVLGMVMGTGIAEAAGTITVYNLWKICWEL